MDPRITKLADILVNYSINVQPGEWVVVSGHTVTTPLAQEIARLIVQAGGHPSVMLNSNEISETIMRHSNEEQLKWESPLARLVYEKANATIGIIGTNNTRSMSGIDPQKQMWRAQGNAGITKIYMDRSASGDLKWTLTQFPCFAYAQDADKSLRDYEDFVFGATFADQHDPVAKWKEFHDRQEKLVDWLRGKEKVVVRGPNVDLTLSIKDRTFINDDGKKNMPGGEIFTSPVEDSVNGWVRYTYPALRGGVEVDGIELEFENGKVVKATAEKNEAYLLSQLDADEGARFLGEFAIGTNYGITKFTKNILFDEKIGGTIHLAIGSGFPEIGGKNVSAVHWDMICDMRKDSSITVDGDLFYQNGEFMV